MGKTMSGIFSRAKSRIKGTKTFFRKSAKSRNSISVKTLIIMPCAFMLTVAAVLTLSFNVSYAYAVSCQGETIGYVSSQDVYSKAIDKLSGQFDDNVKDCLQTVEVTEKVTAGEAMLGVDDLTEAIVENIDAVEQSYGLFKNGELYASCETSDEIERAKTKYVANFSKGMASVDYSDEFVVKSGYYAKSTVLSSEELYNLLVADKTDLGGSKTETKTETVKYETIIKKSDKYAKGKKLLIRNGVDGKKKTVSKVFYQNEVAYKTLVVSSIITKPVVNEVVILGTNANIKPNKMTFPISASYTITSLFGEVRGGSVHRGIDIVTDYGTDIYAAAGGRVIEAGYSAYGWGNNVLIEHSNGVRTRYAHCSSLNVKVGDIVTRNKVIAQVGSTGDSECNHLHFEVYNNGTRVDPMLYF